MEPWIYLDNAATTKIRKEALEVYIKVSEEQFGNPSSLHHVGLAAEHVLKEARDRVLFALGETEGTVVLTASGSEANNLAIFGRAYAKERFRRAGKLLFGAGEHSSVRAVFSKLAEDGFQTAAIPTAGGSLDLSFLCRELTASTVLVSCMMVNNETGALYDIAALARMVHAVCPDALLHVDATQSFLKVPFSPRKLGIDLLTVSSHKIEGPKGVGALWIHPEVLKKRGLTPMILGGGQEGGLRSGTENVPGAAAFGVAAMLGKEALSQNAAHCEALRSYLLTQLTADELLATIRPLEPAQHAPHILNLTLPGIKSETMLHHLSSLGICVSSGSACSSNGAHHPSAALLAYGHTAAEADTSIRISLCRHNTKEEMDALLFGLKDGLQRLARIRK